ncbi:tRNA(Ile)-lysidine synthase TilS/MesJ [Methanonatronarchaeum thermophilum]|uniref:tRNA(Ile)-lysidine synthase TilS/MesJ n=1 Tax=Methanonatronarchaeum thermophilum TaxID=1927129 RepID=A0A1Y3G9V5_9EURY|nr:TIGR00269 family protein [Methanonatronarchaeum thermophilum]OUJ18189.1 tRNA(Ile)-lysidine synthase TilS/MesJ [Methanonatronarchaeum thermophilum]
MDCDKCSQEAVIHQKYSGLHLCQTHLMESVESKVKQTLRKNCDIQHGQRIGIALSGGKDSSVLLHIMHQVFGEWPDLDLICISVDEGITGYRDPSIELATKKTNELDIEHHVYSFKKEVGYTLDEISNTVGDEKTCRYCGILRRWILNKKSKTLNLDKIAIGHNLDDESQSALMNFLDGDVDRLARQGPEINNKKGFIPRIKPLREVPEKEIGLYALINNKVDAHFDECPYSDWALRQEARKILNKYETNHPGTKYSILRSVDQIAPNIPKKNIDLNNCQKCSEPTTNKNCRACQIIKKLQKTH